MVKNGSKPQVEVYRRLTFVGQGIKCHGSVRLIYLRYNALNSTLEKYHSKLAKRNFKLGLYQK